MIKCTVTCGVKLIIFSRITSNPALFFQHLSRLTAKRTSNLNNKTHMREVSQWPHNERDGVSNHQPHDFLLNRLFRRRSKKTSKLRVTGLYEENSPVTGEFPTQRANNAENVSIWWRHHVNPLTDGLPSPRISNDKSVSMSWCHHGTHFNSSPLEKWPPFRRRYFQIHFYEWKILCFD